MQVGSLSVERVARAPRSSMIVLGLAALLCVIAGAAAGQGRMEAAFAVAGGFFGVAALRRLSLSAWCLALLLTTVGIRIVVTSFGLPQAFNFLHFGVVAGFAIAALLRPVRPASRAPTRWLAAFALLTLASMWGSGSHPLRALLFLVIAGEPLVVIWALTRWGVPSRDRRLIGATVLALAAIQLPIGAVQAATRGFFDPVQGTLLGHGAGHHVLGALFALGLLTVAAAFTAGRVGVTAGLIGAAVSLGMMLATGSMAVTILTGLAVMTIPFLAVSTARTAGVLRLAPRYVAAIAVVIAASIAALSLVQLLVPKIYERSERLLTVEELPEVITLKEYAAGDLGLLLLGSGPGTTASRASTLLVGAEQRGHPLLFFGLDPTPQAEEIVSSTRHERGGSAEAFSSGALAIIGDLGVVGFAALLLLFWRIWREAARSRDWLAPAARAALILTGLLIFVANWLEYPEFAVPLAILLGIVLSDRGTSDGPDTRIEPWVREPVETA